MQSRRTVLRTAIALATGSALAGTAGSASTTQPGPLSPYDAGTVAGAETTIAAQVSPAAVDRAHLPDAVESRLSALRDRFAALSPAALGPARGSLALDGERVVGAGVRIGGDVDREPVAEELTTGSYGRVRAAGPEGVDVYRSESAPYAVGLSADAIAVGYGPGDESPLVHVNAVLDSDTDTSDRLRSVGDAVGGAARVAATLGSGTRSSAIDRVPSDADGLAPIVERADAFGVGVDVGADRSRVSYGVEVDPAAISPDTYWDLITRSSDRADGFELSGVERDGRLVVVRGTVPTEGLWPVHADLLGLD
jgi:hypothetical protein